MTEAETSLIAENQRLRDANSEVYKRLEAIEGNYNAIKRAVERVTRTIRDNPNMPAGPTGRLLETVLELVERGF